MIWEIEVRNRSTIPPPPDFGETWPFPTEKLLPTYRPCPWVTHAKLFGWVNTCGLRNRGPKSRYQNIRVGKLLASCYLRNRGPQDSNLCAQDSNSWCAQDSNLCALDSNLCAQDSNSCAQNMQLARTRYVNKHSRHGRFLFLISLYRKKSSRKSRGKMTRYSTRSIYKRLF